MKRPLISILSGIVAMLAIVTAPALLAQKKTASMPSSVSEMEKRKQEADIDIRETKAELNANERQVNKTLASLRKIEEDIKVSQNEITTVQGQINTINGQISALEGNIQTGEKELAALREEYLKAVKKMRVARKKNSELAFIFASGSLNEARRRMRYMKEFSEWKDRRSSEIADKVNTLKEQREQLAQARNDAAVALHRQQTVKDKLSDQKKEQETAVAELRANSETLKAKLARRQAEARKLSSQISALIAEERAREAREAEARRKAEEEKRLAEERDARKKEEERKAAEAKQLAQEKTKAEKQEKKKEEPTHKKQEEVKSESEYADARKRQPRTSSSSTPSTESGFGGMKGLLPKPVNGSFKIVSPFGEHPISPDLPDIMDENLGIDVHVANGATASAVYDGEVLKIYDRSNTPGFRNIIVLKHGDYITVYANIETINVRTGQSVKQGQSLGTVGADFDEPSKGLLHFEVWKNQNHLDPAAWIKL